MNKNIFHFSIFLLVFLTMSCKKQDPVSLAVQLIDSEMARCPEAWQLDFREKPKWDYCHGLEGEAILAIYDKTGDRKYLDYIEAYADMMINEKGEIRTYKMSNYNIDHINPGKLLFKLYDITGKEKYTKAIDTLYAQLQSQPRTSEGGFWHKQRYPHQMWLDGLYMGSPFYAEYAARNNRPEDFADVVKQFVLAGKYTYDPESELFRHAWDESRNQKWADPIRGQSPHVWGRAMGWYTMALVDVLDFIPEDQEGRDALLYILNTAAKGIKKYQDEKSGIWYQITDMGDRENNYLESTSSCMFTYSLLKGVRKGYIDDSYLETAKKGYKGIVKNFIEKDSDGLLTLTGCCAVAGLGGDPYRDGSYEYYMSEPVRDNDPKGISPFVFASLEYDLLENQ